MHLRFSMRALPFIEACEAFRFIGLREFWIASACAWRPCLRRKRRPWGSICTVIRPSAILRAPLRPLIPAEFPIGVLQSMSLPP